MYTERHTVDDYIYGLIEDANKQPTTLSRDTNIDKVCDLADFETKLYRVYKHVVHDVYNMVYKQGLTKERVCSNLDITSDIFQEIIDIVRIHAIRCLSSSDSKV